MGYYTCYVYHDFWFLTWIFLIRKILFVTQWLVSQSSVCCILLLHQDFYDGEKIFRIKTSRFMIPTMDFPNREVIFKDLSDILPRWILISRGNSNIYISYQRPYLSIIHITFANKSKWFLRSEDHSFGISICPRFSKWNNDLKKPSYDQNDIILQLIDVAREKPVWWALYLHHEWKHVIRT